MRSTESQPSNGWGWGSKSGAENWEGQRTRARWYERAGLPEDLGCGSQDCPNAFPPVRAL